MEALRDFARGAGAWGILGLWATFALGELLHVPGLVFVAAAVLAYDQFWGFVVAFVGAVVATCTSFLVVRTVGGRALVDIQQPLLRRGLARRDTHPVSTVVVLRTFFWMAPALNYALALSNVAFGPYALGSSLGLVLPLLLATAFIEALVPLLSCPHRRCRSCAPRSPAIRSSLEGCYPRRA